jgi:hypothetical protein
MPFFYVRAKIEEICYFGLFDSLHSFDSPDVPYDRETLAAIEGEGAAGFVTHIYLRPTLQGKYGPVIFRNILDLSWWSHEVKGPCTYDVVNDVIVRAEKEVLIDNSFMVWCKVISRDNGDTLLVGPYHQYTHVEEARISRTRHGVTVVWTPPVTFGHFSSPMIVAGSPVTSLTKVGKGRSTPMRGSSLPLNKWHPLTDYS